MSIFCRIGTLHIIYNNLVLWINEDNCNTQNTLFLLCCHTVYDCCDLIVVILRVAKPQSKIPKKTVEYSTISVQ